MSGLGFSKIAGLHEPVCRTKKVQCQRDLVCDDASGTALAHFVNATSVTYQGNQRFSPLCRGPTLSANSPRADLSRGLFLILTRVEWVGVKI